MSDSGLTTDTAPTGTPVPSEQAATPVAAQPPAPPAGGADPLGELPADRAVFDRGYVEDIRREAAKFRTSANEAKGALEQYEQVFGVYEPDDRAVWMDLARTWAQDPSRAAAVMQQIASSVLDDGTSPDQPASNGTGVADPPFSEMLTPEKVKELVEEGLRARDAATAEKDAVNDVFAEVRAGGFDPETAEGFMVLYNANHFTGGDINKAIEMTQQYRQGVIDDYVKGRTGAAALPSANGGFTAIGAPAEIKNLDDAKKAADAYLRERRNAS